MIKNKKQEQHFINEKIKSLTVRLVGDNVEQGIYQIEDALKIANDLNLDLVEVSPNICKIIDYKKFLYEQKKRKKPSKLIIKEIRLGSNIDEHDFDFKLKQAIKFLKEGVKLKIDILFKGRTIQFKERGEIVLLKFAQELIEYGKIEQLPKLEGKKMMMIISSKKIKKN